MSNLNIAVYAEGCMYPSGPNGQSAVSTTITQLQQSGFTTAILGLFHIDASGDISFNNTKVFSDGGYVGQMSWPDLVNGIPAGTVTTVSTICASIGGGGVGDFANIKSIYATPDSPEKDNLISNFQKLRATFPVISIIDMDCEDAYDVPSFVAFCQTLIGLGFGITFCPYTAQDSFWNPSLAALNSSSPGAVKWWNLQCYDGGGVNAPGVWATSIVEAIPGFLCNGFILAGDWTDDSPAQVTSLMEQFKAETCVGGGFIWTLDQIIQNNASGPLAAMQAYVNAISSALPVGASIANTVWKCLNDDATTFQLRFGPLSQSGPATGVHFNYSNGVTTDICWGETPSNVDPGHLLGVYCPDNTDWNPLNGMWVGRHYEGNGTGHGIWQPSEAVNHKYQGFTMTKNTG